MKTVIETRMSVGMAVSKRATMNLSIMRPCLRVLRLARALVFGKPVLR